MCFCVTSDIVVVEAELNSRRCNNRRKNIEMERVLLIGLDVVAVMAAETITVAVTTMQIVRVIPLTMVEYYY